MMNLASAYNGGAQTLISSKEEIEAGNTVGSLSEEERAVIVGCLLGDGAMRCKVNALLEINHSIAQKDYVDWKYKILRRFVLTPPKSRQGNGKRIAYRFTTRSIPELTVMHQWFYCSGRKCVPNDIDLSPLSLAVWVMDDGCKSHRAMYLNTQQFTIEEQKLLIDELTRQFNICASLNRDKQYTRIRITVESVRRLYNVTKPRLLPMFQYKFPLMTP